MRWLLLRIVGVVNGQNSIVKKNVRVNVWTAERAIISSNKNAFQKDAYRPLVARISQHALLPGGVPAGGCTCHGGVPTWGVYLPWAGCSFPGGVPTRGYLPGGLYLPRG